MSIIDDILVAVDDDDLSKLELEEIFSDIKISTLFSGLGRLLSSKLILYIGRGVNKTYRISSYGTEIVEEHLLNLNNFVENKSYKWMLVSLTTSEIYKSEREKIRISLKNKGFGIVRNGLFIGKVYNVALFNAYLDQLVINSNVVNFSLEKIPDSIEGNIDKYWDLKKLSKDYSNWLVRANKYFKHLHKNTRYNRIRAKLLVYQLSNIVIRDPKISNPTVEKVLNRNIIMKTYNSLREYCYLE